MTEWERLVAYATRQATESSRRWLVYRPRGADGVRRGWVAHPVGDHRHERSRGVPSPAVRQSRFGALLARVPAGSSC